MAMKSPNSNAEAPVLVANLEGAEGQNHRIEADHLARILEALQKSLRNFARDALSANGSKATRHERDLAHKYSTLEVIAFLPDSFSVHFTLAHPPGSSKSSLDAVGRSALATMIKALRAFAHEKSSGINGHTLKSLAPFIEMAPLLQNGLEQIRLNMPMEAGLSVVLNQNVCRSLEQKLSIEQQAAEVIADNPVSRLEPPASQKLTADSLLRSSLVGMWSDRPEVANSSQFARTLRDKAETRER